MEGFMKSKIYGYIRVSTISQNYSRQWIAMKNFGIPENCIFADKQSGKDFERPAYQELLRHLSQDDVLVIKSLDRLGRDYNEMLEKWRIITKEIGASIVVLDLPLLDTRKRYANDLTGILISDIVLQLFSYVAQTEREMNKQRTMEGIAAAKARGVKFGRKPITKPDNFSEIRRAWALGKISEREAAKKLGVSRPTFHKWAKK